MDEHNFCKHRIAPKLHATIWLVKWIILTSVATTTIVQGPSATKLRCNNVQCRYSLRLEFKKDSALWPDHCGAEGGSRWWPPRPEAWTSRAGRRSARWRRWLRWTPASGNSASWLSCLVLKQELFNLTSIRVKNEVRVTLLAIETSDEFVQLI